MVNRERIIECFLELIGIDSETGSERQIADFLLNYFEELGIESFEDDTAKKTGHEAGNIIASIKGNRNAAPVYFTAHMDTVKPGKGIKVIRKDKLITSDGSTVLGADDKVGLAALLEIAKVLSMTPVNHGPVQFIITAGEESGLVGASALNPQHIKADYGFALDSEGKVGTIITAAPYRSKIKATIKGKKAHAGVAPENGVSSIIMASKAIASMPLGRIDEDTTANIGLINGGTSENVVCDHVEVFAEARSLIKDKLEEQIKAMTSSFHSVAEDMGGKAEVEVNHIYAGFKYREEDPLVQLVKKAIISIGRECVIKQSGGGCDANVISSYGIPSLNLGVGYEKIHSTEEQVPEEEIVKTAELVLAIIKQGSQDN